MGHYAWAIPIPAGKTEEFRRYFAEALGARREGYDDFQRRQGVRAERYYLQSGPDGDIFIIVGEGDIAPLASDLDPSRPWDRWFHERNRAIFGIDLTAATSAELSESLGEWDSAPGFPESIP